MGKRMDWRRLGVEKRIQENGIADAEGRVSISGERDRRPVDTKIGTEDAVGRAVSDFIQELARRDFGGESAPKVPQDRVATPSASRCTRLGHRLASAAGAIQMGLPKSS